MSRYPATTHDIPHSPPFDGSFEQGSNEQVAVIQARLNEIARRDPRSLLGVLEHWLGPNSLGDGDAGER